MATETIIKGRANKNPPYEYLTKAKWNSLGQTMTLKQALDKWWNSIRVGTKKYGILLCYKCYDGDYVIDIYNNCKAQENVEPKLEDVSFYNSLLKTKIELFDCYYEDGDGYPVVDADLIED